MRQRIKVVFLDENTNNTPLLEFNAEVEPTDFVRPIQKFRYVANGLNSTAYRVPAMSDQSGKLVIYPCTPCDEPAFNSFQHKELSVKITPITGGPCDEAICGVWKYQIERCQDFGSLSLKGRFPSPEQHHPTQA